MKNRTAAHSDEAMQDGTGFYTVLITENKPGYYPLASTSSTLQEARAYAADLNRAMGISEDDRLDILASSIAKGPVR